MGVVAAYDAKIRLDGTTFLGSEWEVDADCGAFDGTTFEDAGFEKSFRGVRRARISVRGFWDPDDNYFETPPSLLDGQTNSNMRLYEEGIGGLFWSFPYYLVEKVRMMAQVRDGVKVDFDARNWGIYFYPGGWS